MEKDQINELTAKIREEYLSKEYNGKNNIIQTENVIFQVTYLKDQTDPNNNLELSIIDLGECEEILKKHYEIPFEESLIIYKTDTKTSNLAQNFIQYEIYNPMKLERLDISICENFLITINSKVNLDNSKISLYESLIKSGYNLFNESDSFYTDICSTYTSQNGTDLTLADRKTEIFDKNGNISLCQIGCKLKDFNSTTQNIRCECEPQKNEIEVISTYSDEKFIIEMFKYTMVNTIKNSNFLVLKCYKLAFNTDNLLKNIGRIIMSIIMVISLIFLFIFLFIDFKKLDTFFLSIVNNKKNKNEKRKGNNKKEIKNNKIMNKKDNLDINNNKNKKIKNIINNKVSGPPKKNILLSEINSRINSLDNSAKNIISKNIENLNNKKENINSNKKIININSSINIIKIKNLSIKKYKKKDNRENKKENINDLINSKSLNTFSSQKRIYEKLILKSFNYLNEQELNELKYEKAIDLDKRSFSQYYISILKKNQIILFTFFRFQDYNLFSIKICLFLTNFSLYLTLNCFFFSDKIMHKIFKDNGAFRIIYQLPQILYTSIISIIVNLILKQLSLSERHFFDLKMKSNINISDCKIIKRLLKIKFLFFFIINYLFISFFWYYISCFSAVFINTQIIMISDTLISFGLTLLYPFGYYLIPTILRILSLRSRKKEKKCLYMISRFLSLI